MANACQSRVTGIGTGTHGPFLRNQKTVATVHRNNDESTLACGRKRHVVRARKRTVGNKNGNVCVGGSNDVGIGLLVVVQLVQCATDCALVEINDPNDVVGEVIAHLGIAKTTKAPLNQKATRAGQSS